VAKLIQSAVANASDLSKGQVDVDALYVNTISVDQGPTLKRFMPRAMGRATPIHKKSSHVHVVLADTPVRSRKARSRHLGSEGPSHRFPPRGHQDLGQQVVRAQELRPVAPRGHPDP